MFRVVLWPLYVSYFDKLVIRLGFSVIVKSNTHAVMPMNCSLKAIITFSSRQKIT